MYGWFWNGLKCLKCLYKIVLTKLRLNSESPKWLCSVHYAVNRLDFSQLKKKKQDFTTAFTWLSSFKVGSIIIPKICNRGFLKWGQRKVDGRGPAGAIDSRHDDLCLVLIKIQEIQCHPFPDVNEAVKERLGRAHTNLLHWEINLTVVCIKMKGTTCFWKTVSCTKNFIKNH